jgi:hypothetical protein
MLIWLTATYTLRPAVRQSMLPYVATASVSVVGYDVPVTIQRLAAPIVTFTVPPVLELLIAPVGVDGAAIRGHHRARWACNRGAMEDNRHARRGAAATHPGQCPSGARRRRVTAIGAYG